MTDVCNEWNIFEKFLEEIIQELGINSNSEGILTAALCAGYDLIAQLQLEEPLRFQVEGNHLGVFFSFLPGKVGYDRMVQWLESSNDDVNIQKMRLLAENIDLNSKKGMITLQFELQSIYSKVSKERSMLLKDYLSNTKVETLQHDSNKRSGR